MEASSNASLNKLDQEYYLQTFKRYPIAFEKGEGSRLWDVEGNEYIDALAGIAVCNLGHCHPEVTKAIREQAGQLVHISNFFVSKPQTELAKKLCTLSNMDRVFFTNSGAESVEGAIKLARKFARSKGKAGEVIAMTNSFHGRTLATIAMGKKTMQDGFGPMPEGFQQIDFNDIEAVKAAINPNTAAIILEPVQGEGGIHVAEKAYLKELREICDKEHIALIFDEIQCGIGRTGKLFAKEHYGVEPDIMTLAKGLGGGMPIGAILCKQKVDDAINYGDHGTTFGGNPLACAASLATIDLISNPTFLKEVEEKGRYFKDKILNAALPHLEEVRGLGLMIGAVFSFETKPLVAKILEHKVIANATANNVLRLVPPLVITEKEIDKVVEVIAASVKEVSNG
ncbi:aspartate aminotransferase family protein [Fulvivirga sp. RKSG066]|uniref:aspartate aminotransferase family protein n=1 Tax=Fulvivirga aurantia TaxID=2529383 RepID=UPI0012BC32D2|nr:aspartate aminotransferase family protein [Fulvivirga aurantia]MTI22360.1 aspartate aminotransferase family protein [Fulvivirga aurantia]